MKPAPPGWPRISTALHDEDAARAIDGLFQAANTQNLMVYRDDIEGPQRQGARQVQAKTTGYGEEYWADRADGCEDIEGHHWWFSQRLRSTKSKV